jgi:hypothetical protein
MALRYLEHSEGRDFVWGGGGAARPLAQAPPKQTNKNVQVLVGCGYGGGGGGCGPRCWPAQHKQLIPTPKPRQKGQLSCASTAEGRLAPAGTERPPLIGQRKPRQGLGVGRCVYICEAHTISNKSQEPISPYHILGTYGLIGKALAKRYFRSL